MVDVRDFYFIAAAQAQSELLDMVAALKVKLEKKYALEMKREVELRVSTQIKLLTEQHESRVGKQMLKMKADYEERLNGLTLMHQTLLDKALHESDSMKAQLMEFNTSNVRQTPFVGGCRVGQIRHSGARRSGGISAVEVVWDFVMYLLAHF